MALVFKISGALLLAALIGGQLWQHRPASANQRQEMLRIADACPALPARDVEDATQFDFITLRDAYWRKMIFDAGAGFLGARADACGTA